MSIESIALIFLGVIVLGFLALAGVFGLGLYLGWFNIGSGNTAGKDDFRFHDGRGSDPKEKGTVRAAVQDLDQVQHEDRRRDDGGQG